MQNSLLVVKPAVAALNKIFSSSPSSSNNKSRKSSNSSSNYNDGNEDDDNKYSSSLRNAAGSLSSYKSSRAASSSETCDLPKSHCTYLQQAYDQQGRTDHSLSQYINLEIDAESPPLFSYGMPNESSGAMFDGQFRINVFKTPQTFDHLKVRLFRVISFQPSLSAHYDKGEMREELGSWNFAEKPVNLTPGEHTFPLSYLFPGHLPATTLSCYAKIYYQFMATVKTASGSQMSCLRAVNLGRVIRSIDERHWTRVFPPTNITADIAVNPVCSNESEIAVSLCLSGMKTSGDKIDLRWMLRTLTWRIEEYQQITLPDRKKQPNNISKGKPSLVCKQVKTLGEGKVWWRESPLKIDPSSGKIHSRFVATMDPESKPIPGISVEHIQFQVWHNLVIEMTVVQEYIEKQRPSQAIPTGSARILRAQLPLIVTNYADSSVAWDEELTPLYQDVPPSPPEYVAASA